MTVPALSLFHQGHPGVAGMQGKLRRVLYWPGWTKAAYQFVQGCGSCAARANARPQPNFFMEPPPEYPGDHLAADHFVFNSECYLACVDLFLGFPFLFRCKSASAASLVSAMQQIFLQTGLPRILQSDQGPAFMSEPLQNFLKECHVRHRASTAQYAQSNGAAECAVHTLKHLRAKASNVSQLFQMVLQLQNTPRGVLQATPADIFLGSSQPTTTNPVSRQFTRPWPEQHAHLVQQQDKSCSVAWGHWRPTSFLPGASALLRDFFGRPTTVSVVGYGDAPRSYKVKLPSSVVTERNTSFLFPIPRMPTMMTVTPSPTTPLPTKTQVTSSPAAGSYVPPVATRSSCLPSSVPPVQPRPSSPVLPTVGSVQPPSPRTCCRPTVPAPLQVAPGLPCDTPSLLRRSERPSSPRNMTATPTVTSPDGTAAAGSNVHANSKWPVQPTRWMLLAASQGFRPAQLFVRRHRPPPGPVSHPRIDLMLQSSMPHPPSPDVTPGRSSLVTPTSQPSSPLLSPTRTSPWPPDTSPTPRPTPPP